MAPHLIRAATLALTLLSAGAACALELVFFTRPGCPYCIKWEREVAPIYEKSEEARRAPLARHDLAQGPSRHALAYPVRYTPTFVLADKGREIGRITGFINDDMFWGLLGKMLKEVPEKAAMAPDAPRETK